MINQLKWRLPFAKTGHRPCRPICKWNTSILLLVVWRCSLIMNSSIKQTYLSRLVRGPLRWWFASSIPVIRSTSVSTFLCSVKLSRSFDHRWNGALTEEGGVRGAHRGPQVYHSSCTVTCFSRKIRTFYRKQFSILLHWSNFEEVETILTIFFLQSNMTLKLITSTCMYFSILLSIP